LASSLEHRVRECLYGPLFSTRARAAPSGYRYSDDLIPGYAWDYCVNRRKELLLQSGLHLSGGQGMMLQSSRAMPSFTSADVIATLFCLSRINAARDLYFLLTLTL